MWNSRALLHGLGLVALSSLGLGSCGGDVGIIVTVENWPSSSPYLLVDTQVNGTPGQQMCIRDSPQSEASGSKRTWRPDQADLPGVRLCVF